jgi:hypothetical protein
VNDTLRNPRPKKPWKAMVFGVFFVVGMVGLFVISMRRGERAPEFLENRGEGFEHLIAAQEEMAGDAGALTNGFASFVAMNKRGYDAIDRAMKEEVEAPARLYEPGRMTSKDFVSFKRIGQALLARSKAAEAEGNFGEAAERCLETIRFAQNAEHGPLISQLVGLAVESMAMTQLEKVAPKMVDTNLATVIPKLLEANRSRIAYGEVMRRERYFMSRHVTNFVDAVKATFSPQSRTMIKQGEEKYLKTAARMEALATALAARRFEISKNGSTRLSSVKELKPEFLRETPMDPFSKKELKVGRSPEGLVIYSVGVNGLDEAGKGDDVVVKVK